jgi:hypothetical protein
MNLTVIQEKKLCSIQAQERCREKVKEKNKMFIHLIEIRKKKKRKRFFSAEGTKIRRRKKNNIIFKVKSDCNVFG